MDEYRDVAATLRKLRAAENADEDSAELRAQIVERCLPLAEHIAQRFRGRGEPFDDLVQVARVGLVGAIDRFDPSRGGDFVSFAVPTIRGELRRHFRDQGWVVHVSRQAKEMQAAITRSANRLAQDQRASPSVREIADDLHVRTDEVQSGLAVRSAYQPDSMDAPTSSDPEGHNLGEVLGGPDEDFEAAEQAAAVEPYLSALPQRERRILRLRFFSGMTQSQIAGRLQLSQMHVSRLLRRTLTDLRSKISDPR